MVKSLSILLLSATILFTGCGGDNSNKSKTNEPINVEKTDTLGTKDDVIVSDKQKLSFTLSSFENIAGYEIKLKFANNLPTDNDLILDSSFLGTNGRTVGNLGSNIKISENTIKFGAYSYGSQDGVSGSFKILTINTKDSLSNISIFEKICTDKDANIVDCMLKIENN